MKAVRLHGHGGLDQLHYEDAPVPAVRADEVLIRVKATALNHLDLWTIGGVPGLKLEFPHILGNDMAGVVEAVGELVANVKVGDEVVVAPGRSCGHCRECAAGDDNLCNEYWLYGYQLNGGFAQYAAVRAANVLPKPAHIDWPEAASASLVFLTAWHMLVGRAALKPGETCLVMAAGSGVGIAAVQIAALVGARVIAAAGSDDKLEKAKALGAESVVNYSDPEWPRRVRQLTGKRGVDVVAEHTGEQFFAGCVAALARGGRLVTCGATSGPRADFDIRLLFAKHLTLYGSYMSSKAEWHEVWKFIATGKLKPVVDRAFPLAQARAAFERMQRREQFGKLVLIPE
jgi:NADPH:quinone reductase-like Zn-dependent oxidoreductase